MTCPLSTKYSPPSGFRLIPNPDYRSDEEIAAILQSHRPVDFSSDKNVSTPVLIRSMLGVADFKSHANPTQTALRVTSFLSSTSFH